MSLSLLWLMLLVPQCMITHGIVSRNEISPAPNKIFSTLSPPIPKLNEDLKDFFLTCSYLLSPGATESPTIMICTVELCDSCGSLGIQVCVSMVLLICSPCHCHLLSVYLHSCFILPSQISSIRKLTSTLSSLSAN